MEGGEGMVAVVRGLRDSGLAVTLLDGNRQYTLMPNAVQTQSPPTHVHISQHTCDRAQTQETMEPPRSDSAAQATDGRYASMYKMAHCKVTPTSPPVQLTEFPPQRAELCRGHGNFEVGGLGSGENYSPCRSNGSFRGAMSWPDRGSVCSPRPSREPDAFANSLRKYPNVSVERSTEMVERLITYTQAKNVSKSYQSRYPSPSRHGTESNTSNQFALDRNASRNTVPRSSSYQKNYEPEVKVKPRLEESPTRDLRTDCDFGDYRRQMAKKVKDNLRSLSSHPYNQPVVSPVIRERYEQNIHISGFKTSSPLTATNSVNMEVQAAAKMVSKEVATVVSSEPIKRTVAVPLSPTSSCDDQKPEGDVSHHRRTILNSNPPTYKSVETASMPVDLSVQTTSSSIDIANPIHNCRCFVIKRKSKSDVNLHKGFGDEIYELLEKVSVCPNSDPQACDLRREVLKQMSTKLQKMSENIDWNEGTENTKIEIGNLLKYVPIWVPYGDVQKYREAISDEIISRMNRYKSYDVYRAETHFKISNEERNLDDVLKTWISNIPLKSIDIFGKPVEKGNITEIFLNRLKRLIQNMPKQFESNSLKAEIVNIISKLPIAVNEFIKSEYLNKLAESLLKQLKSNTFLKHDGDKYITKADSRKQKRQNIINRFKKYIQPTEEELKEYILDELKNFLERTCSKTNSVDIKDVEVEIIDYLIDSIQAIRSGNDYFVESELIMLLCQDIDNISWYDAKQITKKLIELVKTMFGSDATNQEGAQTITNQPQEYVVLQNTAKTCLHNQTNTNDSFHNVSDFSIGAISKEDIDANLDAYMNQLTTQIDDWLASLQMHIPQAHDSGFRQVVVHDLAGDIIDRHKYLELNPSSRGSDGDELEHLKYQIFKWINKLAGEDNMDTIEHAPELMQRIQQIPVPMLTRPQQNVTKDGSFNSQNGNNVNSMARGVNPSQIPSMSINNSIINLNQSQAKPDLTTSCCSSTHIKPLTPSMKQLNAEYDDFLKKWVQEIPIPSSTPAEKALVDKARLGIYNGVWKAITKLKFEPATFNNPFYYEDALDDELEELLSALPKTSELETKKHLLKVQLIEKTTNTNQLIKSTAAPASFRQQLVENVFNNLPNRTANKEDPEQSQEKIQVLKLVEDYILCSNYKDIDNAKAKIYRKKLIQEAQTLVDNLKKTHGKELQDIDTDLYINSIFNALHQVPIPNEEIVKDEAEEIMLGAEVEQWFLDLPVVSNDDRNEQLQRKILKDALVKRIREIEKEVNIFDCTGERVLKHEISSFLEKVPMQHSESFNITFMAEEFANRMKNRAKNIQAGNVPRKSVAFMDSVGYYEFSQNMPQCSSFSDLPGARPAVANQSSYMIRDGTRVQNPYGYDYYAEASLPPHVPLPSEEYFTLEDSQSPPQPKQPQMQPQPMQEHNQYSRIQSYKSIPAMTLHETMEQSVTPNIQLNHQSVRDRTVPNIESPERQQSPCCRSAAGSPVRQPTTQNLNQSGQVPRLSARIDQFSSPAQQIQNTSIPPHAQTPCSARNQNNTSRVINASQQQVGEPIQTSMVNPQGITGIDQLPQVPYRSPERMPPPQSDSFRAADQIRQPVEQLGETSQRIPGRTRYGEPQGFSTPQQVITQGSPPRPGRKRARNSQRHRPNLERRRLELEYDTEGFESEVDEPCHCTERTMRCRRPPVCFAYEDFEMDQCYPSPYGSLPLVTNNFTVQMCADVRMRPRSGDQELTQKISDTSLRNIKAVQTSFSSVDLVPTEKCCNCHRKIKSQEDLRNRDNDIQLQNEMLDWLKEIYKGEASTKLGEKMQKLAQTLTKPGGEEKIKQKIQKYLKRLPSQFSECDEERQEFRKRLPESIIKKLKKMYLRPERRRNYSSPVRIFRIEIPKDYCNVEDKFKSVIKNWLKEIPIKKRDFLGRGIKKEDVLDSVVFQLEPYILNRQNFDKDYTSILKATIVEILDNMPIEMDGFDKPSYCNRLALSLLNDIIRIKSLEHHSAISNSEVHEDLSYDKKLKQFVSNQIANILNKLHLTASTKRLQFLEEELKSTLEEVMNPKKDNFSDETKDNIFTILHKLGGLSDYQANYFTDIILKHFKEEFGKNEQENDQLLDYRDASSAINSMYNDTYSVFHNTAKQSDVSNRKSFNINIEGLTISDEIKSNVVFNKRRLIVQIEDWLNELQLKIPFKNKDKAVKELAEDIIDRYKYLEINPASKGPEENELQYLKYQIFKWINKVVGENTMETIEHANELMKRIQNIDAPTFVKYKEDKSAISQVRAMKDKVRYSQFVRLITDCLKNIPNALEDVPNKTQIVDDLASNVIKHKETDTNIDAIVNKEIDSWIKNVYRGKNKWVVKNKLNRTILENIHSRIGSSIDLKKEKILIRKYEDLIDEWIDDFVKRSNDVVNFGNRNQHTHDLAVQLFNLINSEESHSKKHLEDITLEWLETCVGKRLFQQDFISTLVQSVLDYNELNQDRDETNNSTQLKIDNKPNTIPSFRQNEKHIKIEKRIAPSDIAVYGVTLPSNPKAGNTSIGESSIQEIHDDDIKASLDFYLKQLVEQIDGWLGTLNIPQINDKGFREIVVNDLAGDIIDRHKYLELNSSSRVSDENELEHLKYQIFKWINKLVGEEQHETVEHASDLMNRIRSIPVPMLTKHSETSEKRVTNRNVDSVINKANTSANPSNVRLSSPLGFTTGPMATTNKQNVVQMPLLSPQVPRSSLPAKPNIFAKDRRFSGPPALGIPKTPTQQLKTHSEETGNLPQGVSIDEVHQYFDIILQERLKEIPLETPTPEQEMLADLARKGIYNGIWKTYFQLKADPEIENDYSYFGMVFEDQLDKMLDCLPQTNEIQKIRQAWKIKVLSDVMSMLKYVHSMTDRPSFRQMIAQKFNRQYLREHDLKGSNMLQQQYVACIAKNYILHAKYKEEDPVKANIYRQRLMKKVEELAESVKNHNNVEFKAINHAQFCQLAIQLLKTVPIPHDETLTEEVEEILIGEEIDQWYSGLPVKPVRNETDEDLRKRMKELLAKKVHEIEKQIDLDESAEQNLRHEVSKFLQEKAELQSGVDLKINFMVEELTNRLKNRRQQNMVGYESFEKEKPISSTFVQTDNIEVFAPLVDAGVDVEGLNPYEVQEAGVVRESLTNQQQIMQGQNNREPFQSIRQMRAPCCQGQGSSGPSQIARLNGQVSYQEQMGLTSQPCHQGQGIRTSEVAGLSNQVPLHQQMRHASPPCCQGQGISENSQIAGPSSQVPFHQPMGQPLPPCSQSQGQGILGSSQVAGPSGQVTYQQPIDHMPPPYRHSQGNIGSTQTARPSQGYSMDPPRLGNQSYRSGNAPDRSHISPRAETCALDLPPSQIGPEQIYQGNMQPLDEAATSSVRRSTDFLITNDPSPTAATRSTARLPSSVPDQEPDEETDGEEEIRYKCRCMERVWKCKKQHYYEDVGRPPPYYPMPFPCRYFY